MSVKTELNQMQRDAILSNLDNLYKIVCGVKAPERTREEKLAELLRVALFEQEPAAYPAREYDKFCGEGWQHSDVLKENDIAAAYAYCGLWGRRRDLKPYELMRQAIMLLNASQPVYLPEELADVKKRREQQPYIPGTEADPFLK